MRSVIKRLVTEDVLDRGTTAVITSHSLRELEDTCDQLALLHKGGIALQSDISSLKTSLFKVQVVRDKLTTSTYVVNLTSLTPKTCDLYLNICITDESLDEIFERAYLYDSYGYSSFFNLTLSDGSVPLSHAIEILLNEEDRSYDLLNRLVGDRMTTYDPNKPIVKFRYITYDYLSEYTNISDSTVHAIFFEAKDMELFNELSEMRADNGYIHY